ncbi:MAG TPA: DNA mismatch repair protein MutS, partial [Myxococcota bacterium]|nr:DNA mismatch repair protein MutS [Myxococcota bacterium]
MQESEKPKLTPMMEQWASAKNDHPDAILLFRMGDFYELFGDDALLAAPILELALTSRDKDKSGLKMAGFPCHAAELYIAKLIDNGLKVAMCDQLEDPKAKKGIVKRGITQVITPGTLIEAESEGYENAYLLSLVSDNGLFALAALDLGTASFLVTSTKEDEKLIDEIVRLKPKEIVLLAKDQKSLDIVAKVLNRCGPDVSIRVEKRDNIVGQSEANLPPILNTAALLIKSYIIELRGTLPAHIGLAQCYSIDAQMLMDRSTRINLDLLPKNKGDRFNLLGIMQGCKTAMGKRALGKAIISPSTDLSLINSRHDFVAELLKDPALLKDLRELFGSIYDLEKLTALAASNKIGPRYLGRVRDCLISVAAIRAALECSEMPKAVSLAEGLPDLSLLEEELKSALSPSPPMSVKDGGIFCAGYNRELDELTELSTNGHQLLLNLELRERELTGISSLKIKYTRVFGYYIEVTKSNIDRVPSRYQRKQTIANGERYMTEELSELEIRLNSAQESLHRAELRLFENLRQKTVAYARELMIMAETLGMLDMLSLFSDLALKHSFVRPRMLPSEKNLIDIKAGRHPIVEARCHESGIYFVPNDFRLDSESCSMALLTGPNMAGKSTIMRQVAIIQILAQMGSFVPAKEATLSICDSIFARVGASDDLSSGRSTFMVEMTETAHILHNASQHSLILLDEIGRGTSTYDGMSIAQAVAEYIHDNLRSRTLFATHYHELTDLEKQLVRLKNFHVEVEEKADTVNFLYSLKQG